MKNRSQLVIAFSVILIAVFGLYILQSQRYRDTYLPRTEVAGVDVGGKTEAQANQLLQKHFKQQKFTLVEGKKQLLSFTGKTAGVNPDFSQKLAQLKQQQNRWAWPLHLLTGTSTAQASKSLNIDQSTFDQFYKQALHKLNQGRTASKNAAVIKQNGSYTISKAVNGNQFSAKKLKATIQQGLATSSGQITVKAAYTKPTVTADSATLKTAVSKLEKIHNEKITYTINGYKVVVPKATIYSWTTFANGKVSLDEAKVKAYITSLNTKYATINKSRQFKSTKRGTVTVPAGIYGWSINTASETTTLMAKVLEGKDFTRTPTIQGTGYSTDKSDIGNTYVEVDKTNQHMWYYKDGKLVLDTDVVTGKPGQDTPSGVDYIWSKQRNATLKGTNDDGSAYASPVSYWMPVDYTGVGIHDASWQPKFGGDWYKTHGSHGCVNTPTAAVAKLYAAVSAGTPVIIF
ncbi:L,D-transpeptidase family protein [Loigolactobacillus binensis]|uniref:L,D-transpeptidase/peptidoglycan binding protein n=1 Tax=Loigolactobacillus binensis TaxID=2559922 RepID=A0ABW3EA07_9LACO|nr:L,D-transpeptidase/peptidoglycan binding protein [Loigolactobacillus binensis]